MSGHVPPAGESHSSPSGESHSSPTGESHSSPTGDALGEDFVERDPARQSFVSDSASLTSVLPSLSPSTPPGAASVSPQPTSVFSGENDDRSGKQRLSDFGSGARLRHASPSPISQPSAGSQRSDRASLSDSATMNIPAEKPASPRRCPDSDGSASGEARRPAGEEGQSVFVFMHYLMGTDPYASGRDDDSADADLTDAWSIAPRRRGVYNLVQVPMRFERLMVFCGCICLDEFLFLFTLLPIRCATAALRGAFACLRWVFGPFVNHPGASRRGNLRKDCQPFRASTIIDFMHMSIFVFTSLLLSSVDISSVYHSIRGQSVIKLYVVFNVMEIFDRLCCSFGVDILDSLGWTTGNAVNYLNSKRLSRSRAQSPVRENAAVGSRPFRGFVLVTRVTVDYLFALVYVCFHATLLLIWVVTLNVAINTQNNALLTLLVSNNFVELKSAAFKSYKVQNLFQIACSDAVERFQLSVFLGVMLVYAEGDWRLLLTWAIIFSSEVLVDWIKHAFMTKFNRIPHRAYQQFSMVICRDVVQTKKNSAVRSIGGSGVAKRIGFISIPLGALVVRMASKNIARLPQPIPAILFLIMLTTKISLSVGLLGHAIRRLKPQSACGEYEVAVNSADADDNEAWYQSLANVGRYDKS